MPSSAAAARPSMPLRRTIQRDFQSMEKENWIWRHWKCEVNLRTCLTAEGGFWVERVGMKGLRCFRSMVTFTMSSGDTNSDVLIPMMTEPFNSHFKGKLNQDYSIVQFRTNICSCICKHSYSLQRGIIYAQKETWTTFAHITSRKLSQPTLASTSGAYKRVKRVWTIISVSSIK